MRSVYRAPDPRFAPSTLALDLPALVADRRDEGRLLDRTAAVERVRGTTAGDAADAIDALREALGLGDPSDEVASAAAVSVDVETVPRGDLDANGREPAARTLVRRLDGGDTRSDDPDREDQTSGVNDPEGARWGVLTDGRRWRLYGGGDPDEERFYEFDLETATERSDDPADGGPDVRSDDALARFVALFGREAFETGGADVDGRSFLDALSAADAARRSALRESLCDRFVAAVEALSGLGDDPRPAAATALGLRLVFDLFVADRTGAPAFGDGGGAFGAVRERLAARTDDGTMLDAADRESLRTWVASAAESTLGGAFAAAPASDAVDATALAADLADADATLERVCALLSTADARNERRPVDYRAVDARHLADLHERLVAAGRDDDGPGRSARRKADGSFYTPESVVTYLGARTAGSLVADARDAAGAREDGDVRATVRAHVLDCRVLDPAAGGGALLLAVARRLVRGVRRTARRADAPTEPLADISRAIVARCLYGVDRSPAAAAVARLCCLAETLGPGTDRGDLPAQSDRLAAHLRCGDALLGPGPDADADVETAPVPDAETGSGSRESLRTIRWNSDFSAAFGEENSGQSGVAFDAVVGNPPWKGTAGRAGVSARLDGDTAAHLREAFESAAGPQPNLYAAFLERACRLAPGGYVAFVVPDALLVRLSAEPARRFLLGPGGLTSALRVGDVFPDANEGAAVVVCEPPVGDDIDPRADVRTWFGDAEEFAAAAAADSFDYGRLRRDAVEGEAYARLQLLRDETADGVFRKLERLDPFETVGSIARGEEFGKRDPRVRTTPTAGTRRLVPGAAVRPYALRPSEVRHVDAEAVVKDAYDPPKLLCRQTGRFLVAALDEAGVANLKSVYDVHVDGGDERLLLHLLALLNSTVYNYYHYVRRNAYPAQFPQQTQRNYETLPVWDGAVDGELVSLAARRSALGGDRAALDTAVDAVVGFESASVPLERFDPVTADDAFAGSHRGEAPGLRIADLSVRFDGRTLTLRATYETDADAGRVGDDPGSPGARDVLRFEEVTPREAAVLSTWLPSVGRAPATRRRACGLRPVGRSPRTSPAARLRSVRVPDPAAHAGSMARCARDRRRAAVLDERATDLDDRIDARVCELVGLTDAERAHVREMMADAPGWVSVRRPPE